MPNDTITRLGHCLIMISAYCRLVELRAIQFGVTVIPVTDQDMKDYDFLENWWNQLPEWHRESIVIWKDEFSTQGQVANATRDWLSHSGVPVARKDVKLVVPGGEE